VPFISSLPWVAKFAIPLVAGGFTASLAMAGIVYTQTAAPDTNPADTPILTYGDET
jgi:hypothetical protein